ncbi:hypothetical protein [Mycobacterium asiaticum]|uniref:hypothetical protein n=1 Tax=Mycobacterium asiaticum TaxID=1790 RepID=UPI000AE9BF91|nr:hypothetical protein [Mycobacterium asiaticum]
MTQPTPRDTQPSLEQPKARRGVGDALDGFLKSPFSGIAPWALLSILSAPGRFEIAVASALAFSVLILLVGLARGIKIHLLEVFGAVFFAALAIVGLFATDSVLRFLEVWAGELTNISLALFAWFTVLIRRPFTMAYAKDTTPQEYWDSPLFKRINNVITAVWASAFTFAAAAGFFGDAVLQDAGNFWTGWILQLAAIFFAIAFTEFYPDYASAMFDLDNGEAAEVPSMLQMVEWLPTFIVVTGVVGLVTDSVDFLLGIGLIVGGSVASGILAKFSGAK